MKLLIVLLSIFISISSVSAIIISEVEINPLEGSSGREWIELYNDGENDSDISGWEIWEGISGTSGPKKILSIENETTIQEGGFYIIELSSAKLNNDGDFVILYDLSGTKIDETETLKETTFSTKTHQYCNGKWEFLEETKNSENNCPTEESEENEKVNEINNETNVSKNSVVEEPVVKNLSSPKKTELKTINLNPKVIKSEENSQVSGKRYAIYGLFAFGVLLGLLFLIKNFIRKKYKNEFK